MTDVAKTVSYQDFTDVVQYVGWGSALQAGRSRVQFPKGLLGFLVDLILPVALCLWGRLSF
jgi:hypothetical protein